MFGFFKSSSESLLEAIKQPTVDFSRSASLEVVGGYTGATPYSPNMPSFGVHNGEKFAGGSGFGPAIVLDIDYWSLRTKSSELFQRNLYARGIIRRLVTNIISTGLTLEASPSELVLGLPEGSTEDWTDAVEEYFDLWASTPDLCDYQRSQNYGALQRELYREALIEGDILVVKRLDPVFLVPKIQLISGNKIKNPFLVNRNETREIVEGVELDETGRHVAFWVEQKDGTYNRLPAFDAEGNPLAWLFYASDKRKDEVRGQPILALILQSLKEVDRYRDSTQRKAVINSMLALFVERTADAVASNPLAQLAKTVSSGVSEQSSARQQMETELMNPGLVIDHLSQGETIKGFPTTGADASFSDFESGILQGIAWCLEIPPEILMLGFNSNYSASAAALNEFGVFVNVVRSNISKTFCKPIYKDWLLNEILGKRIVANGFLNAWRKKDARSAYTISAWVQSDWAGQVKPSTDPHKLMKGIQLMLNNGCLSFEQAAKMMNGSKFNHNIKKQKRERELAFDAKVPLSADPGQFTDSAIDENKDMSNV